MTRLSRKAKNLPDKPGVYLFRSNSWKVIYVGKAISLKKRIASYFKKSSGEKASIIVNNAMELEYIITSSELEALLLENNLIKKHKPRYNVLLRDDKQFPYIKITINEEWPRVLIVRKVENDGADYFGPYRGLTAREIIRMFKRLLQLRWCKNVKNRKEPCFYYHLKKCLAPCMGYISKKEYKTIVNEAIDFLKGNVEGIVEKLKKEMETASKSQEYEKAGRIRDRIRSFGKILESQEVLSAKKDDKDIVAFTLLGNNAMFLIFQIRKGKLIGKESYFIKDNKSESEADLLNSSIIQYYTSVTNMPKEIIVKPGFKGKSKLQRTISRISGRKIKIISTTIGSNLKLYKLAEVNVNYLIEQNLRLETGVIESLNELKTCLFLSNIPKRIEAFDISTTMGTETVGSMVVFEEGKPYKSDYRKFKVRFDGKPNDFAAMKEVIGRRYRGMLAKDLPLPDLILIDGGKPQISAAKSAVLDTAACNIRMAGLAKKQEHIFIPGRKNPIILPRRSGALKLVQRIRDEAHRFAITYHKQRRKKSMVG